MLRDKRQWNSDHNTKLSIDENAFEKSSANWRPFCPRGEEYITLCDCCDGRHVPHAPELICWCNLYDIMSCQSDKLYNALWDMNLLMFYRLVWFFCNINFCNRFGASIIWRSSSHSPLEIIVNLVWYSDSFIVLLVFICVYLYIAIHVFKPFHSGRTHVILRNLSYSIPFHFHDSLW